MKPDLSGPSVCPSVCLSVCPSALPGVLLEHPALVTNVDAVDDKGQNEGDDVFGEGAAPAVRTTRRVHDRPPTEAAGVSAGEVSVKLELHDQTRD